MMMTQQPISASSIHYKKEIKQNIHIYVPIGKEKRKKG